LGLFSIGDLRVKYKLLVQNALGDKYDYADKVEELLAIKTQLKTRNIPLAALEDGDNATDAEVEKNIQRALRCHHLKRALHIYDRMARRELHELSAGQDRQKLYDSLDYLGWPISRLGAARGETHKDVARNIEEAVRTAYAMAARRWFRTLGIYSEDQNDPPQDEYVMKYLKSGGLGYAALDPSGAASEADMKDLFEKTVRRAHLICARKTYRAFTTQAQEETLIQYYEDRIVSSLAKAGAGPQDLLPDHRFHNPGDIIPAARVKQHMLCAQKALDEIRVQKQTEKTLISWRGKRVRENVARAGCGLKDIFKNATDEEHASDLLNYEIACAEARYLEQKEGVIVGVPPVLRRKKPVLKI
jgi:hypothetical protein